MRRFRDALSRFMYGRNGVDALNWALIALELVLSVVCSFVRVRAVANALSFLSFVLMFIVLIRMFSRNLDQRRAENAKFLAWWAPKANALRGAKARTDKELDKALAQAIRLVTKADIRGWFKHCGYSLARK